MAQARQRLGRAGRQCPGQCYRLYTEEQFYCLESSTTPEIQRCNLSSIVLQLLALGVKDVVHFDFLDAPSPKAIENAWEQLKLLGALDEARNEVTILFILLRLTSPHPHFISLHPTPLQPTHLTSPHLTSPHPTSSHFNPPHLASPHLTSPHFSLLYFLALNPSNLANIAYGDWSKDGQVSAGAAVFKGDPALG